MQLEPYLNLSAFMVLEKPARQVDVLRALAERAASLMGIDVDVLFAGLVDREEKYPTGTPEQVAFPHVLLPQIQRTVLVPALLKPGVPWGTAGHPRQDVVFGMFGNSERPWEHVRMLARLARIARGPGALDRMRAAENEQEFYEALLAEDRAHG